MKADLIKIVESKDLSNYKIKYKIRQRCSLFQEDLHQLVIKYKKKNSLLYTELYKNLENYAFAFTDIMYEKKDDIHIFKYLKDNPDDDILENMVKYAVVNDINEKEKIYENNQINSVPLKWLFYTSIKNK